MTFEDVRGRSYDDLLTAQLEKYLEDLERESLPRKLAVLHEVCQPTSEAPPGTTCTLDSDKVSKIDKMRHDIVHGERPAKPIPNAEEHIAYLYSTQWYVLWVIQSRYGVKVDLERLFPALSSILATPDPSGAQGASLPSL